MLLLFLPMGGFLWWSFRRMRGMAKARKVLATVIRALVVSLLILALAGPESVRKNQGTCTVFILDRSDSVSDADRRGQLDFVNRALPSLGPDDEASVVVAGREPQLETVSGKHTAIDRVLSVLDGSATNLAAAIRLAIASFPDGKGRRIVVLTDGNETQGDALDAAATAATEGVAIDFVPMGVKPRTGEVTVLSAELPTEVRAGQPYALRVQAHAETATTGMLEVQRDGVMIDRRPVRLSPGKNTFTFNQQLDRPGFFRYKVTIESPDDQDHRNNLGVGFVSVRSKPKILVLQDDLKKTELANALRGQNIDVDVFGPEGSPVRPEQAYVYDAIFLNDMNAAGITTQQMRILQAAVRDGGVGLAMVGGENSFLPGGWYGSPVADALPVDLNIRQRKSFPSTSILIICDTSGSMGMIEDGVPKVRLAAKAAEETVRLLAPQDRAGVMASTDGIEFVAPMQQLANKEAVISQVRRLGVGGGGIYCLPSMQKAEQILMAESTKVRHLILLGDGSDCDSQDGCYAVAMRMKMNKITTSCVSIGEGPHSPFLKTLAAAGGGNYYLAKRASQLPAIFTQDAAVMSRSAIEEGAFIPKVSGGEPILRGIDSTPALYGYCLADTRPLTRVGMRSHKDDVLLASWQYGLGTSLAFTSDAKSQWARGWVGWNGFSQFWAQAARSITRRNTKTKYEVRAAQDASGGKITIKGRDERGNPVNEPPSEIRVTGPDGKAKPVIITQTGPGEFESKVAADDVGSYIVTVAEKNPNGIATSSAGFSVPYPAEYRFTRTNLPLLEQMAEATGGQKLVDPKDAVRQAPELGYSIGELWLWLVLAASLLFPLDVGVRRVALPIAEIWQKAIAFARRRREPVAKPAPAHLERLSAAKASAKKTASDDEDAPRPVTVATVATQEHKKMAKSDPVSAGSKLLDAKKRRKGE